MRVPIAYYLMLLYVTVMFKPLLPLINDALSHTFAEAIHIATVHAVYGSNHLEKDLSNTASENSNNKHQAGTNTEDQLSLHVSSSECLYNFYIAGTGNTFSILKLFRLKTCFISKHSPPPRLT